MDGKKNGDSIHPPRHHYAFGRAARHSGNAGGIPHANKQGGIEKLPRTFSWGGACLYRCDGFAQTERVVALPEALLEQGGLHYSEDLPFKVRVLDFGPNCEFNALPPANKAKGPTAGVNRGVIQSANLEIRPKPEDFSSDGMNFGYVVFELLDGAESLGTWAAISHPAGNHWWAQINPKMGDLAFQPIRMNGRLWGATLRPEREYLPYSIELLGIANEFYQGTDIPFNFESEIVLNMEKNESRRALVYMNTPLRHEGKTFYQYQMNKSADYTVFQVVRNPSWLVPYIACILVSIGLLWQFSFHLVRFLNKNSGANRAAV